MITKRSQATTNAQIKSRITEYVSICAEWARTRQAQVALTQPPMTLPPGIKSFPRHGSYLSDEDRCRKASPDLHAWPHASVASGRYPQMVAIMEGEADFRIGITESMRQAAPEIPNDYQMQILQAPRASLLLIPPGVPISDGESIPHWERPDLENAESTILWCYFISHGALLYFCTTKGRRHTYSEPMFLLDPWLLSMSEILFENMLRSKGRMDNVDHTVMLALLLSIERDCRSHQDKLGAWPQRDEDLDEPANSIFGDDDQAIDRARQYIETHLHLKEAMNVAQIAAHAFVSTSHLNRLFRARLNCSIMDYVVEQRIDLAKRLLHETDLSVTEISRVVGYTRPNYFARVFSKSTGRQPGEYRQEKAGQHRRRLKSPLRVEHTSPDSRPGWK